MSNILGNFKVSYIAGSFDENEQIVAKQKVNLLESLFYWLKTKSALLGEIRIDWRFPKYINLRWLIVLTHNSTVAVRINQIYFEKINSINPMVLGGDEKIKTILLVFF